MIENSGRHHFKELVIVNITSNNCPCYVPPDRLHLEGYSITSVVLTPKLHHLGQASPWSVLAQ